MVPSLRKIETAINLPVGQWNGRCYEVACLIVKAGLVKGEAVYGHYHGPVEDAGFWAKRSNQPFHRHGWIVTPNGTIIDPTRWSFENIEPYLAVLPPGSERQDDYDRGGNRFRELLETPPPLYDSADKLANLEFNGFETEDFIFEILGSPPEITTKMVFWLANLSPKKLGRFAEPIYRMLEAADYKAFIPIDNRQLILGDAEEYKPEKALFRYGGGG